MKTQGTQRSIYVVLEGVEAAGKTTVLRTLKDRLGESLSCFKAPSVDGPVGLFIRALFDKSAPTPVDEKAMLHLFAADQIDQESVMTGQLLSGHDVLIDRHNMISAMVYQAETHDPVTVRLVNPKSLYRAPDLLVLLDIFPGEAQKRLDKRQRENPQTTDGKYKTHDINRIAKRRRQYQLAIDELEKDGWAKRTLRINVTSMQTEEVAEQILEAMREARQLH